SNPSRQPIALSLEYYNDYEEKILYELEPPYFFVFVGSRSSKISSLNDELAILRTLMLSLQFGHILNIKVQVSGPLDCPLLDEYSNPKVQLKKNIAFTNIF
ncbi:MAG: hypothetical protein JW939_07025, partial [Candidatus Thermoplasmatota archaeon]|nr:hypothetical protein [Candidatus Thermoplasmatota archaeon]